MTGMGSTRSTKKRLNPVLAFLGYFWAPIPWMIEVALLLSLAARHWADALIIGILLVLNGLVAFMEEHQAAGAIAALKEGGLQPRRASGGTGRGSPSRSANSCPATWSGYVSAM